MLIKRIINFVLMPIFLLDVCVILKAIEARSINVLPYKEAIGIEIEYDVVRLPTYNEKLMTERINALFDFPQYGLNRKNLDAPTLGYCVFFIRLIVVDDIMSLENYVLTLTHELVHLTYFTCNERWVSFMTFKTLYESEDGYFKQIALAYADAQVNHRYPYEYDCGGYIEEYLLCH